MTIETTKFIAIIVCDTHIEALTKFGDFGDQGIQLLRQGGLVEYQFKKFHVMKNEFPTFEELKDCKGMYLTGSRADSFAKDSWILKLIDFLKKCLNDFGFPIVGACFGHQIIAVALGMKTGRSSKGWEMGLTEVQLNSTDLAFTASDKERLSYRIMEMHQDVVLLDDESKLPEGYINIGSSEKCEVQGIFKAGKLLTFQGHPEFSTDCGTILVGNRLKSGSLTEDEFGETMERNKKLINDGNFLGSVMAELILSSKN